MAFPSTFLDLQNVLIAKLRLDANASAGTGADIGKVKDFINLAYSTVCIETEANIVSGTFTLTSGQSAYSMATVLPNAVKIKQMFVTPVGGPASRPLEAVSLDDMIRFRMYGGGAVDATGSITNYTLMGVDDLEVYPTPSAADIVTAWYVKEPTYLSASADVTILPEPYSTQAITFLAGAELADFRSDPSEAEYRQLADYWVGKTKAFLGRRQGNLPQQMQVIGARPFRPHNPSVDQGM